jgi:outer membrane protein assembly factor BamB
LPLLFVAIPVLRWWDEVLRVGNLPVLSVARAARGRSPTANSKSTGHGIRRKYLRWLLQPRLLLSRLAQRAEVKWLDEAQLLNAPTSQMQSIRFPHILSWLLMMVGAATMALGAPAWSQPSVLTQHNDNMRTGANLAETRLNTSNVHARKFGKLFTRSVDGQIYAQPLYVPGVVLPGARRYNVVYVATQHNSVYAFDADDPEAGKPLWHVNLGRSARTPNDDFGNRAGRFTNIVPEVGITSTPVIDRGTGTIYVVAFTKDALPQGRYKYVHRLHALDITTGRARRNSPTIISGSVRGRGAASVGGVVAFDSGQHLQRASLLLSKGRVVIAFAGFADTPPYHGWVFSYDAATLARRAIFNTTPNGAEGGIWQGGQGPAADGNGDIFLATSNGTCSANARPRGVDYGDSALKLSPRANQPHSLHVADWFTPHNQPSLSKYDMDFGNCGPLLIPGTNLLVQGTKNKGLMYVLNRTNLGRFRRGSDRQIVQSFRVSDGSIFGSPIFWRSPAGPVLYVWGVNDRLKAFRLREQRARGGRFETTPSSQSRSKAPPHTIPGGILSLSANGSKAGSGIVWATLPLKDNPAGKTVEGILRAFDASDLSRELWNSKQVARRDDLGSFAKFCPPTIANGRVYAPTFSRQLVVYGLLPSVPTSTKPSVTTP